LELLGSSVDKMAVAINRTTLRHFKILLLTRTGDFSIVDSIKKRVCNLLKGKED
jgi:hypothetical protein